MPLRHELVVSFFTNQKIIANSSIEIELIGTYYVLSLVLWTHFVFEAKGYKISENILFQHNKSTIFLKKYGHSSSSKYTKILEPIMF